MCTKTLTVGLMCILFTGYVYALPVVDGRFDLSEGYTTGTYLDLFVESTGYAPDKGQLWLYQDDTSFDLYVAVILPVTLVDNSYGDNSIGWGGDAPSGKHHNFEDIVGSDGVEFQLLNDIGDTLLQFELDYFSGDGDGYVSQIKSVDDGIGDTTMVTAWATSLEYNFNVLDHVLTENSPQADTEYAVVDPAYSEWVFEVVYELRIDGSIFGDNGFGSMEIPVIHASPNKIGRNKVFPEGGEPVPEPMTLLLLGLGGLITRRFKH